MNRRMTRSFLLSLVVGLGMALLPTISSASPLVYLQVLARQDGTDNAFSNTITPTSVGEEFDYIVVATLAPAGTKNTNLPVDGLGNQTIGSWQSGTTGNLPLTDGLGALLYAMYESPSAGTQVSFQAGGYLGTGGSNTIDPNIFNGLNTKRGTAASTLLNGNATFSGGVNTFSYGYTVSGNIQPSPGITLKPTSLSQSAGGYAIFQNFGAGAGSSGGNATTRGNGNNDLTNVVAISGTSAPYLGVDPNTGVSGQTATTALPMSIILQSGSNVGGPTYGVGPAMPPATGNDPNGTDSTFKIVTLGGSSTVNLNAFDMNPGNPGGALTSTSDFLNIQYHDTTGAVVKPGTSSSLQYMTQTGADPVVQFTGLTIVGSSNTSVLAFNPTTLNFNRVLKNSTPTLNANLTNTPTNGADTGSFTGVTSNTGISGPATGGPVPGGSPGTLAVPIQLQNNANGTGTVGNNSWTYTVTNTSNPSDTGAGKTVNVFADVVAPRVLTPNPVVVSGTLGPAGGSISIPFSFTSTGDLANTTSVIVNNGGGTLTSNGFTTGGSYTFNGGMATIGNVSFNLATDTYTASGTISGTLTAGQTVTGSFSLPVSTLETGLGDTYAPIVVNFTAQSVAGAIADGSNSPTAFRPGDHTVRGRRRQLRRHHLDGRQRKWHRGRFRRAHDGHDPGWHQQHGSPAVGVDVVADP